MGDEIKGKAHEGSTLGYERSMEVFKQLAAAVLYCHKQGVAHRAGEPANTLLVDEHKVKIVNFGHAFDMKEKGTQTDNMLLWSNPPYTPPEIVMYGSFFEATGSFPEYDAREYDLWFLGMMLYEMLTGELPAYTKSTILNDPEH